MYFIPYGLAIQGFDPAFVASLGDKVSLAGLSWQNFLINNLLPVTLGNILGGGVMVGAVYWLIYRSAARKTAPQEQTVIADKKSSPDAMRSSAD
jgi:formate transporter